MRVTPQYKLRTATVAVCQGDEGPVAITIPRGAILKITDDRASASGLVEADWNGRRVHVFSVDLHSRGEVVKARSG